MTTTTAVIALVISLGLLGLSHMVLKAARKLFGDTKALLDGWDETKEGE